MYSFANNVEPSTLNSRLDIHNKPVLEFRAFQKQKACTQKGVPMHIHEKQILFQAKVQVGA